LTDLSRLIILKQIRIKTFGTSDRISSLNLYLIIEEYVIIY